MSLKNPLSAALISSVFACVCVAPVLLLSARMIGRIMEAVEYRSWDFLRIMIVALKLGLLPIQVVHPL